MMCQKCGKVARILIGQNSSYSLCSDCFDLWEKFLDPKRREIFDTLRGTPQFHEFWENLMQRFLSNAKERVMFT